VTFGDREVGTLTSVAVISDGWVALAVIGRAAQPGDEVVVAATAGTPIALEAVLTGGC
jgi:hypothetical protein